jgi:sterol desaturase/sphingolipid hydroxylase (fatty acid hydroxylase superfamily)
MQNELAFRLMMFLGAFFTLALLEIMWPRRKLTVSKPQRWISNFSIAILYSFIARILFPAATVGVALFARNHGWGILSYLHCPFWLSVILSVIILDLIIYSQHVMFHKIPLLWRVHRMHHTDLDFDVTTGIRFHPLEILLSLLIKFSAVCLLGAPVISVIIFEVLLNVTSMFNHSNLKLLLKFDRLLRLITVTPDMHRVHHSVRLEETNSNFGFNLSWWDHLFGTYQNQPKDWHLNMMIGIPEFRDTKHCITLPGMILIPFISK